MMSLTTRPLSKTLLFRSFPKHLVGAAAAGAQTTPTTRQMTILSKESKEEYLKNVSYTTSYSTVLSLHY